MHEGGPKAGLPRAKAFWTARAPQGMLRSMLCMAEWCAACCAWRDGVQHAVHGGMVRSMLCMAG
eukprot:202519-Chlamydomonas_euryale.AAC.1